MDDGNAWMKSDTKWCDTQYGNPQIHPTAERATMLNPVQSNLQSRRNTMTTLIYSQKCCYSTEGFKYSTAIT